MRVRIIRKLADRVDGIDLTHCDVGTVMDLPEPEARVMVAERWALPARRSTDVPTSSHALTADSAAGRRLQPDRRHTSTSSDLYQRLREKREQIERDRRQLRRRATDAGRSPTIHAA